MSKLYAVLDADSGRTEVTRCGHHNLRSTLKTWGKAIETRLHVEDGEKRGEYTVRFAVEKVGLNSGQREVLAEGNLVA